jgi:hypothetical protein
MAASAMNNETHPWVQRLGAIGWALECHVEIQGLLQSTMHCVYRRAARRHTWQ